MKRIILLTLVMIWSLVLVACGGGQEAASGEEAGAAEAEPIKIGAIFDLSGPTAGPGVPYAEGIKGYVDWKNQNGGVAGRQLDLVSQDYAYQVPNAEQLYSQFVTEEEVIVFQGWGTGDTEALRGKIAEDKVPFMSASYSINLAREEAPYNFLVGTSYSDQMVIALQWIKEQGGTKVAVLHHDSPFGQSPVPDGQEFAEANGMEMLAVAMPGGATDLTPELTQIQNFEAEYIIIQNVASPAALAMRNAKDLGMDVQFVCLNWCADESLVELAEDAAEGAVGTIPFTPPSVDVEGDDEIRTYVEENTDQSLEEWGLHYAQGWWTMAVMVEGIERVLAEGQPLTGENVKAALEGIQNYDTGGITAPISFSADDRRGNKALRLYQIQDGAWAQITDYIESSIEVN